MKRSFVFLALTIYVFALLPSKTMGQLFVNAHQPFFEVGLTVGPAFFLGDLGGNPGKGSRFVKDVNLGHVHAMGGAWLTYFPLRQLGLRASFQAGKLSGDDGAIRETGSDEMFRRQRNLNFRTNLLEAFVAGEIYPTLLGNHQPAPAWLPYGVLGVGIFHFNPQGSMSNNSGTMNWVYLKPLHTEGQGFAEYPSRREYALTQINIPFGAGLKYELNSGVRIAFEILYRKTFTDYIDDVSTEYIDPHLFDSYLPESTALVARQTADKMFSIVDPSLSRNEPGTQRGNPLQKDAYFHTALRVGFRLGSNSSKTGNSYKKAGGNRFRCPKIY